MFLRCNGMQLSSVVSIQRGHQEGRIRRFSYRDFKSKQPSAYALGSHVSRFTPFLLSFCSPSLVLPPSPVTAAMQGSQVENPLIVSDKNRGVTENR